MRRSKDRYQEPSKESLKEIPELDLETARSQPNPFYARLKKHGVGVKVKIVSKRSKLAEEHGTPCEMNFTTEEWTRLEGIVPPNRTLRQFMKIAVMQAASREEHRRMDVKPLTYDGDPRTETEKHADEHARIAAEAGDWWYFGWDPEAMEEQFKKAERELLRRPGRRRRAKSSRAKQ